jgi:chromosome segregation ATPase
MQQAMNEQEQLKSEINKTRHMLDDAQQKLARHRDRLHELKDEKSRLTAECFKVQVTASQWNLWVEHHH